MAYNIGNVLLISSDHIVPRVFFHVLLNAYYIYSTNGTHYSTKTDVIMALFTETQHNFVFSTGPGLCFIKSDLKLKA